MNGAEPSKPRNFHNKSNVRTFPFTPFSSSSKDETNYEKHRRNKHISKAPEAKSHAKPKNYYFLTSSDREICTKSSEQDSAVPNISCNPRDRFVQQPLSLPVRPILPILQTAKKNYRQVVDFCKYRLAYRSTRYDETLKSYICRRVNKLKSEKMSRFVDPSDPIFIIFIIGLRAVFNWLATPKNFHEDEAMRVLPFFVKNVLAPKLNSRMSAVAYTSLVVVSGSTTEQLIRKKLLRFIWRLPTLFLRKSPATKLLLK